MNKFIRLFVLVFTISTIFSCDSLNIERRRYNRGFFIDFSKNGEANKKIGKEKANRKFAFAKKRIDFRSDELTSMELSKNFRHSSLVVTDSKIPSVKAPNASIQKKYKENVAVERPKKFIKSGNHVTNVNKFKRSKATANNSDFQFILISLLTGIISLLSFNTFVSRLKPLASWAQQNMNKAKTIILLSKGALSFGGFYLGKYLHDMNWVNTPLTDNVLFGLAGITAILYPVRNSASRFWKSSYKKQKLYSYGIGFLGLLLMVNFGNRLAANPTFSTVTNSVSTVLNLKTKQSEVYGTTVKSSPDKISNKWRNFWFIVLKVFLSILALAIAFCMLYLVAALSCSLSCNGQDTAAAVVLILGVSGTIYLLIISFLAIWKKWKIQLKTPKPVTG